ncbi:hypothetical protein KC19_VG314700 [Ceratodon purpureus]|uniref:Uncharacterized protein n=1 Tax=Ceratodon purpureus TaxID=3225 RepID=A0A8T0HVF1_CERPU|nr:hypothetical protein KC19_VG314700 [Ceratodon purpureus]
MSYFSFNDVNSSSSIKHSLAKIRLFQEIDHERHDKILGETSPCFFVRPPYDHLLVPTWEVLMSLSKICSSQPFSEFNDVNAHFLPLIVNTRSILDTVFFPQFFDHSKLNKIVGILLS